MRLSILGGGGFRVPLVYRALLDDPARSVSELTLYDTDPRRVAVISDVLARLAQGRTRPVPVRVAETLDAALTGADFVFSAIRVGGTAGRIRDERIPLSEGVLGQETVGAGGVLYGLRTIPVALHVAERVAALSPGAWVINFTNPAGMVTEAMAQVLGDRVIGICDSPVGLVRRAARAVGADPAALEDPARSGYDYVGLNHLGWLRSLTLDGTDVLPGLLGDATALGSFEEGRLFGPEWLGVLGALPNEYLHYYYFRRETLHSVRDTRETRGEFLDRQQGGFFERAAAAGAPDAVYDLWERTRLEREETYMAHSREATGGWQRDSDDLEGGGYDRVALALMHAIAGDSGRRLILNVRNGTTVPQLAPDAIVETVCEVTAKGARPLPCAPLREDQLGLMLQIKAVERETVAAALFKDRDAALRALALHPLVDSPAVAARILQRAATDSGRT
ncbi:MULTISPECIES: 6-phospho-beta-glucosidase [Streptomyces]|uniref:6-phospho-beta-glucosidase n=2 Tax=Streptomyces TaxID=1883 RepID=A0A2N8PMM0_STRNR|nr:MULTISPECIES: 6-phospho-beta-glucosidase [Streptomyces]PNE42267.1 6-phospho-beta-glucosidase [Streptomyces noursei]SHK75036.1 6-phospho-beta-glucosidase [Streptomyces yunnanensis]